MNLHLTLGLKMDLQNLTCMNFELSNQVNFCNIVKQYRWTICLWIKMWIANNLI